MVVNSSLLNGRAMEIGKTAGNQRETWLMPRRH